MSPRPQNEARGTTLIELAISVAIMLIVLSAALAVIVAGSNMTSAAERRGAAEDAARMALDAISRSAANAGVGAPGGVYVHHAGAPATELISPVFGYDGGASGIDDLWLVVADRNVLREPSALSPSDPSNSCKAPSPATPGSAALNYTAGTGPLQVSCITSFDGYETLLASNGVTAALIFSPRLTSGSPGAPSTINYDGQGSYSDAPTRGGFQPGDLVYGVKIIRYYVEKNPRTNRPALYMATGRVDPAGSSSTPPSTSFTFVNPTVVQDHIEDLQVEYLLARSEFDADPNLYVSSTGCPSGKPASCGFKPRLRGIQVAVVATTATPLRLTDSSLRLLGPPKSLSNHDRSAAMPDGYDRVIYSRRLELPNLAPSLL